jgi:DNA-binding transcriptional LysR family regulator
VAAMKGAADAWISDMHLFVAVAKAKSFTRAAHHLGVPHSTLSRRVAALEKTLGFRLFIRTTRQVDLTDEGLLYFERAEKVVADAIQIHEELSFRRGRPGGLLRVSIPEGVALQVAAPWFGEFAEMFPDVRLQIDTAPEHIVPVRDGFDVCITHFRVEESSQVRRTLASFKTGLFASPGYARKRGLPQTPEELSEHDCITVTDGRQGQLFWNLYRGDERLTVPVSGKVTTLSQQITPALAMQDLGITSVMPRPFEKDVEEGRLVRVLEDWQLDPMVVSLVLPDRLVSARTRAFIDFVSAKYKQLASQFERA